MLLALLFVPLEHLLPVRRGQRTRRPGAGTDILHFTVTSLLAQLATLAALIPIFLVARRVVPDTVSPTIASLPALRQFALALVIGEVGFYWGHRLAHTIPWWWRLHRVHHSSEQMDWLAAARLHPFDQALVRAAAALPLLALGFSQSAFAGFVVVTQLLAIAIHANVRVRLGPFRWMVVSPQFHHWHHAGEVVNVNFAGTLPIVDAVFGTAHLPAREWPQRYGADAPAPSGWWHQLTWGLRRGATPGGSG